MDYYISSISINDRLYSIKDAQSRNDLLTLLGEHALEALKQGAWSSVDNSLSGTVVGVPTSSAVKSYVDSVIQTIPTFEIVVVDELPIASAATFGKMYLVDTPSPTQGNYYEEYITIRDIQEELYVYSWELLGTTELDLSGYVQKTTTIAGIDLQDNITDTELKTALGLKNLAYKNSAYVPVPTVTGMTVNSFTPSGNVSAPNILVTKTVNSIAPLKTTGAPTTLDLTKFNGGTAATWSGASYTAPTLSNASVSEFVTSALTATIGTGDNAETLIFSVAPVSNAVVSQGTFNAGTVNFGTFNGGSPASLDYGFYTVGTAPTVDTAINVVTNVSASLQSAPTFTGDAVNLNTTVISDSINYEVSFRTN